MSARRKVLLGIAGFYVFGIVLLAVIFGVTQHKNTSFQIQNEFKLVDWVSLGVLSINRAVLYLFLATILTIGTMVYIAGRMQARPNRVQTAVEALYSLMRDNITRGNMPDELSRKWFPFLGTLFLFIWFSNLIGYVPLPTNSQEPGAGADRLPEEPDSDGHPRADPDPARAGRDPLDADAVAVTDDPALREHPGRPHDHPVHVGRPGGDPRAPVPRLVHAALRDHRLPVRADPRGNPAGVHLRHSLRHLHRWRGHSPLTPEGAPECISC
jgi:hypothetical protein